MRTYTGSIVGFTWLLGSACGGSGDGDDRSLAQYGQEMGQSVDALSQTTATHGSDVSAATTLASVHSLEQDYAREMSAHMDRLADAQRAVEQCTSEQRSANKRAQGLRDDTKSHDDDSEVHDDGSETHDDGSEVHDDGSESRDDAGTRDDGSDVHDDGSEAHDDDDSEAHDDGSEVHDGAQDDFEDHDHSSVPEENWTHAHETSTVMKTAMDDANAELERHARAMAAARDESTALTEEQAHQNTMSRTLDRLHAYEDDLTRTTQLLAEQGVSTACSAAR